MRGARRVAHQAARIADIVRDIDQFERVEQREGSGAVAHVECENRPGGDHLLEGQFVARVAGQTGMEQPGHARFDEFAQRDCIFALPARTHVERFEPL